MTYQPPPTASGVYTQNTAYYGYSAQSYTPQAGYQQTAYQYSQQAGPYPSPQTHYYQGAQNYYQTAQTAGYPSPAVQSYPGYYIPQDYVPPSPPPTDFDTPLASVSAKVASQATRHFILTQLKMVGFDGAQSCAMDVLEVRLVKLLENVFKTAHDYGNLANRTYPSPLDLLRACQDYGVDPPSIKKRKLPPRQQQPGVKKRKKVPEMKIDPVPLIPPEPAPPSPELLPSDDDDVPPTIPLTLRSLPYPSYFPPLPPKHTYLRTPPSPPQKATLPSSLERKLANAALVQKSLKNLIESTEDKITIYIPAEKPRLTLTYRGVPKEETAMKDDTDVVEVKEEPLLGMEIDDTSFNKTEPTRGSGPSSNEPSPVPESLPATPSIGQPLRPSISMSTTPQAPPPPPIVLGGLVNWEAAATTGRKRWKLGR